MAKRRRYFGQARIARAYIGPKSVTLHLAREEAFLLAEKVLRAANAVGSLDFTLYPPQGKGGYTQMTVTSVE